MRLVATFGVFLIVSCAFRTRDVLVQELSEGAIVDEVRIMGNRAVSTQFIEQSIQTKTGQPVRLEIIRGDIERILSSGRFTDVRVEGSAGPNGGKIVMFVLRERGR